MNSRKYSLVLIGLVILMIVVILGVFLYFIIITEETHIVAAPDPRYDIGGVTCRITSDDFIQHPALEDLIIGKKYVLISYGPFWDMLLKIDPGSQYHLADRGWSRYSSIRISSDEMRTLLSEYKQCEYNGTVYVIVQSA